MKKQLFLLLLVIHSFSLVSQVQKEFECKIDENYDITTFYRSAGQTADDGAIVINTSIKSLDFVITNAGKDRLKNKPIYRDNRYILIVQPNDYNYKQYNIKITDKNSEYKTETITIPKIQATQSVKIDINPKYNVTKITVLGQDNKPLQGAILTVVGSNQTPPSTDLEGVGRIRLNENREYTVEISHQNYDDTKTIKIKPGEEPQPVRLMKKKPESQPIIALVNVKGHDNQPLSGARVDLFNTSGMPVYAHGLPYYEITKPNGDAPLLLSNDKDYKTGKRYKIKVSHPDYPDGSKSMEVTRTEDKNKPFNIRLTNYNPPKRFNFFSYVVPGLGEFQADRKGEGVFVITSEVVLVGGAGVSYLLSNKYKNTMSKSNVGIDEYNKAAKQYNIMRGVNIVCWSAAAIVYTVHIFRVASLSKKSRRSHAFITPAVMGDDKSFAYGVNLSYTF